MKSEWKPFSILRSGDNPSIDVYSGEIRRDVSVFPWWNHWPVAQKPTDGRWAMAADRPAHSSISHWFWDAYDVTDNSMTKLMLTGFTNKSPKDLIFLNKSWEFPPKVKTDEGVKVKYNQAERAFDVNFTESVREVNLEIMASSESPLLNPAFVFHNTGSKQLSVEVNGKEIPRGKNFRYGHNPTLSNVDLVSWLQLEAEEKTNIKFIIK